MNDDSLPAIPGLLAADRTMRDRCERLHRLAADALASDPDAGIQRRAAALRVEIESTLFAHHEDEETLLFPALIESMAGSDAVCLRDLTELLAGEHRALERTWGLVRQALEGIEAGRPGMPSAEAFRGFIDGYLAHVEREEQELFPMAERLLSDAEFANIEQKLRAAGRP
jgi:hypothetical protein